MSSKQNSKILSTKSVLLIFFPKEDFSTAQLQISAGLESDLTWKQGHWLDGELISPIKINMIYEALTMDHFMWIIGNKDIGWTGS